MEGKTFISTWACDPLPQTIVSSQRHRRPVRGKQKRYEHLTKPNGTSKLAIIILKAGNIYIYIYIYIWFLFNNIIKIDKIWYISCVKFQPKSSLFVSNWGILRGCLHLVTSCVFSWRASYPILKRPGVNALRNAFETHLRRLQEVLWAAFQMKLDKCKCIWLLKPHMLISLLPKY